MSAAAPAGAARTGGALGVLRLLDRVVTAAEATLMVASLALSVGFLVADIVLRVAANVALPWAAEATRYAIVWLVFIGGSRAARTGAHITIDAVPEFLPERPARLVLTAGLVVSSLSCAVLAWYGVALVRQMMNFRQLSPSLEIPMWWVYLALPIGFALMAIRFAQAAFAPRATGHAGSAA
ncbi:TRAP transporter small permease [Lutibaculum baratangense]|uniref:TRAP transporter small permease protein n=1 Tax=Lutibaculum baratangense AMV1 TaxID=631454 RepID=V4RKE3_9HYPH|nr:TRAP transporter small permease [Lutibaculum baratangense]ESR23725.1 C4-dicarboxylate transport system, permease small subunit [Lutibaculum baratangense AMV1]